jgi:hypothetical protein
VREIREVLRLKAEARRSDREIAAALGSGAFDGADATWPYAALLRPSMDSTVTLTWEVGVATGSPDFP